MITLSRTEKDISLPKLLSLSILILLLGHTLLKQNWSSISYIAILFIALLIFWVFRKSQWSVVLMFFVLNTFTFRERAGGVWGYFIIVFSFLYLILGIYKKVPIVLLFLSALILISSMLCFIFYPPSNFDAFVGGWIGVLSPLCLFTLVASTVVTPARAMQFYSTLFFLVIYQFAVTVNIIYGVIKLPFESPLLPGSYSNMFTEAEYLHIMNRPIGTFYNYELSAEWAGLCFFMILPWLYSKWKFKNISFSHMLMTAALSVLIIIATNTRAPFFFLLAFVGVIFLYLFVQFTLKNKTYRYAKFLSVILTCAFVGIILGNAVGFSTFAERIMETKFVGLVPDNRELIWSYSIAAIQRTFPIGIGPLRSYDFAMEIGTYTHSMYLNAPLYYGFIGGFSFFSLLIWILFKMIRARSRLRSSDFYHTLATSMLLFMMFFLVDQFKIEFFRSYAYQNIIFWLLGLGTSVYKLINRRIRRGITSETLYANNMLTYRS